MEEQHFPSRSDRHKKEKTGLFVHKTVEDTQTYDLDETQAFGNTITEQVKEHTASVQDEKISVGQSRDRVYSDVELDGYIERGTKKKRKKLNPILTVLLLLVLLAGGLWSGYTITGMILPDPQANLTDEQKEMLNNINILVLGCDEREGEKQARADVIIAVTIRPEEKEISLFSIPRDTRVSIEGHGKDKINHAMAYGGIPLITKSVEGLLGIQIDHAVKVNFDGFINVIDALGGVNIDVPERMYKPLEAIDLLPGYQTLYGADALAFVRWRGDGTGDYGRIARQQQFIAALTEKVKGMSMGQALDVLDAVMDSIETDMSVREMTSYATNLIGLNSEKVHTYSFVGGSVMINGVSYVEPDTAAIQEIVDKMQHGEPDPIAPEAADGTVTQ